MKRLLCYLALLIAVSPTMADNLYVEDVVVPSGGNISVPIQYQFDTEGLYGGYQFEIILPDGITAVLDGEGNPAFTAGDGFNDSFLAFSGLDSESGNSLFCGFSEAEYIQKASGKLITITLAANNALENGTKLTGKITKAIFGNVDGETSVPVEDVVFHITIGNSGNPEADTDISLLDNAIYIEPIEAVAGSQMVLSVKMKNTVGIQTVQFDLYLPDGVTVAKDGDGFDLIELSTERTTARKMDSFSSRQMSDGAYRVLINSSGGYTFDGEDGEIARVKVNIAEDMAEGDYPLILKDIVLVNKSSEGFETEYVKTTLTVSNYSPGDVNGDGKVNAIDLNAIVNYILESRTFPFSFVEKAADLNDDKKINAIDVNMVTNMILGSAAPKDMETQTSIFVGVLEER